MANAKVVDYQLYSVDPALPVGRMDVATHADPPGTPVRRYYVNARNHGGVDARTTVTETIALAAQGKIVTLNNAAATAVTLDSTVPATFMAYVSAEGAGGATLTPSSGLIDNAANLGLFQLQGVALFFDGTNWWTERGMGAGGSTGVLLKTTNYTTGAGDNGKLISFNLTADSTLTLPAVAPPGTWSIEVENTQDAGLLFVNPNGLMLDESTAEVPIPAPHGMRIFSDGSNYYTERGMPDITAQPCSITVTGSDLFAFDAFALIASFATTTPAANLGFRQAVGAATMQARGGLSVEVNCLQGSTVVLIVEIVNAFMPFYAVQDSNHSTWNTVLVSSGGSYGYLMAYAVNMPAGIDTIEVILSASAITSPIGDVTAAAVGSSAGTGFAIGDFLQVTGGGGTGAILKVATLSGSAIASFTVVSGGTGYSAATNAALTVLTGAGSGAPNANLTLGPFPYVAAPGIPVPSITGITFPKGGLASSNTAPFTYYVSTVNGNTALLGVPPNWIPWSGIAMAALEYQGAGSGVTLLGSAVGTAPGLPVTAGPVPCPPPGTGWSVGAGLNPNRGDPAFPEDYSASAGWKKRITVAQANVNPFFGGGGGFSMAAFDGFGCCAPGFYQQIAGSGGGGGLTQQPKLEFAAPIILTDDPANSATKVTVPDMVGDSGSGGTDGLVPAPPAGSAAAGKFLKADGTFAVPPGTSPLPDPVTPAHGGTGLTTLTAHAVLVGEGTSNVAPVGPGTAGLFLGGAGSSADPSFQNALGSVDARTTATETIAAAARGKLVTLSFATAIAVTLDSTVANYFVCGAQTIGAGTATLTPSSGTINGAASLALATNQSALLFFNGTNWWAMVGAGSSGTVFYQTVRQAGTDKPQEPKLNFTAPITATDNAGVSTDIAVPVFVASGGSHATGLVPDPGSSAGTTKFLREDASFQVPGLSPDPVTPAHGGTGVATLAAHGVLIGEGTSNVAVTATGTTGQVLTSQGSSSDPIYTSEPFDVIFAPNAVLASGAIYDVVVFARTVIFPGNFSGSVGHCHTNPGSTQTINVNKNGSSIGTIVITSAGAFSFTTTGGAAQTFNSGDYMTFTNQGSADASMIMFVTLTGTR